MGNAATLDRILAAIEPLAQRVAHLENAGNKQRHGDKDTGYIGDDDTHSSCSEHEIFFDENEESTQLPPMPTPSNFRDSQDRSQQQQLVADILDESYAEQSDDLVSDAIFEPIAKYLAAWLKQKPKTKDYFELLKDVRYPVNGPELAECPVNEEVFYQLSQAGKQADKRNKLLVNRLLRGIRPLASILHKLIEFESQVPKYNSGHRVLKQGKVTMDFMDLSLCILSATYSLFSYQRKIRLKPYLQGAYAKLCSPSIPITKKLFGDNINDTVKNITNMNKIGKKIMHKPWYRSQYRFQPFDRRSKNFRGRQDRAQARQFYQQRIGRRGQMSPRFRGSRRPNLSRSRPLM